MRLRLGGGELGLAAAGHVTCRYSPLIGAGLSGDLLLAAAHQVRRVAAAVHAAPPRRPVQPQPGELTNHSTAWGHVAAVLTSDWLRRVRAATATAASTWARCAARTTAAAATATATAAPCSARPAASSPTRRCATRSSSASRGSVAG